MPEGLTWPPTKEDLERMYLVEKLSAAKIAKAYALKYASPKTAESTDLYQLKRYGIPRRDKAEHIKKVTPQTVDEWVRRYQEGESLKKIAGGVYSPVTVMTYLDKRGIDRRDKVTAQISAVTKHPRTAFSGDKKMEAYLIGFARGDLNVSLHGRAIRVKTATTHPLMVKHIRHLFGKYGHVNVSPRRSNLAGHEWSVQIDLDSSFSFLIKYRKSLPDWIFRRGYFLAFVAGFFDAEGSIWLNESTIHGFEVSITNSDRNLLEVISNNLRRLGFEFHLGTNRTTSVWKLQMWRRADVEKLLRFLPLKHPEKVAKARIALDLERALQSNGYAALVDEWRSLISEIKSGRDAFVEQAKRELETTIGN